MSQNIIADRLDVDLLNVVDINCMSRILERGTHGGTVTSKYKEALLQAQEKQREAMMKDRIAEENEQTANIRMVLVQEIRNSIKE